jgi:hypothetical protein
VGVENKKEEGIQRTKEETRERERKIIPNF